MSSYASRRVGMGRWIVIGLGVFVFTVFAAVIWYAYVEVMGLGAGGPPLLVRAEPGPIKRAPDDPGGMEIPNRGAAVARVLGENSDGVRNERILPRQDTALVEPEPEAPEPPEPAPAARSEGAIPPSSTPAVERLSAREPESPIETPTTPPSSRQSIVVTNQPPPAAEPPAQRAATPPAPVTVPAPTQQAALPRQLVPPAPPPPAQQAAGPAPARSAPVAGPTYRVQLGAFRSDAAANQAWVALQDRLGTVLDGLRPTVLEANTSAGTFYRLQAGPLSNRDGAVQTCAGVKAGGSDCFIVGPLP